MTPPLIRLRWTHNHPLAADQSFEVFPGEVVHIQGESGAGKSSLLRSLTLLPHGLDGEIEKDALPVAPSDIPLYRRQVQWVPQTPHFPSLTLEKLLKEPFEFKVNKELQFDEEVTRQRLARLLLKNLDWSRKTRDLSGGEKTRIALIRALSLSPQILLLDEPFAHLDPETSKAVSKLLLEDFLSPDRSLVIVSHQVPSLNLGGSVLRKITLKDGRIQ